MDQPPTEPRQRRSRKGAWWRTLLVVVLVVLAVVGLIGSAWTLRSLVATPTTQARLVAQGHRLMEVTAASSPDPLRMQGYFPEGEFFTFILAGIGLARLANLGLYPDLDAHTRAVFLAGALRTLEGIDTAQVQDRFGRIDTLEYGVFYRGWRLALLNAIVAAGETRLVDEQTTEAKAILDAVDSSRSGWVEGYPGAYWPCDTVVGLAAATEALPGQAAPVVRRWLGLTTPTDVSGLLPHRVDATGRVLEGPHGSSQSLIQTFVPTLLAIAGQSESAQWTSFTTSFLARELGVVAFREWPSGQHGVGNVDSGPLIMGLSLSASAVGLAAARANGDQRLALALDREVEWLALGVTTRGLRTYALGLLPVGEAFIFWAKTTPMGVESDSASITVMWWLWALAFTLPALLLLGISVGRRRAPKMTAQLPENDDQQCHETPKRHSQGLVWDADSGR